MLSFRRRIIGLVWIGCFLTPVYWYFERKYYCSTSDWAIIVSLRETWQKCFTYLKSLDSTIMTVQHDISLARSYITRWTNVEYWTEVVTSLENKEKLLKRLQSQTILAINDFERSLFNQVKNLLQYHLAWERESVLRDVERKRAQLEWAKAVGKYEEYKQLSQTMEILQYKLFLLDRVQFSHDFEELVPFLKEYLYGGRF